MTQVRLHPTAVLLPEAEVDGSDALTIECAECYRVLDASKHDTTKLPLCSEHYEAACESLQQKKDVRSISSDVIAAIRKHFHVHPNDIRDILAYRPETEKLLLELQPFKGPRQRYTKPLANKLHFYLTNEHAPYLNMGRWGKPHYNSCQDYTDLSWKGVHLKMQHHTEDPATFIAYIGNKSTNMQARALVRIIQPLTEYTNKSANRGLGIDAFYGESSLAPALVKEIAKYAKAKGFSFVGFISAYHEGDKPYITHHSLPAVFTNDMTSYADIGRWVKINPTQSHHISSLRNIQKV